MINFLLSTTLKTKKALIDSGATENFIDPRTVSQMKLPTKKFNRDRTIHNWKTTFAQKWAAIADKTKEKLKNLPKEYQEHRKVFSEEEAEQPPPHRVEDMEINLKEGAPMELDCRTYPLSDKERKVLCNELDNDIAKGFIKHGTSSYVSPFFFVPKKNGEELWIVIDY